MKVFEWIIEIIILVCILAVYAAVGQIFGLDGLFLGLIIVIYLQ